MGKAASLSYREYLREQMLDEEGKRKGERTRDRLLYAGACVLEEDGYRDSRVATICERAEVSTASFYTYFDNRTELAREILSGFLSRIFRAGDDPVGGDTPYAALLTANSRWLANVNFNAGLMRCVLQLGDEEPVFAEQYREANRLWCERVASVTTERYLPRRSSARVVLLAVHCLGAMMDELARELADGSGSLLSTIAADVTPSDWELAEFVSVIWYRVLYGAAPDDRLRSKAARNLAALKFERRA
jgi:AcrR family transcriptional regulator